MRKDASGFTWSVTIIVLVLNVLVFFLEHANGGALRGAFLNYGALSVKGLSHGFLWQFLTFQFLHSGMMHLVLNCFVLWSFGRMLEQTLGKRSFFTLYLCSGFAGGVLQILLAMLWPDRFGGPMVGASAGISGLIAGFALLSPQSQIYLFMVIPVRAKYFLHGMIALSILLIVLGSQDGIAHGAHLGGALFAVAYFRWLRGSDRFAGLWQRFIPRRRSRPVVKVRFPKVNSSSWEPGHAGPPVGDEGDFMTREVNPILEKISAHGIHSLTPQEREILERARAKMERH